MPYYKLLRNIILSKDLTGSEVLRRCEKEGVHINKTYFSKIINNKVPPPTEEISQAIAKACDVDEKILIIEGYIDKAPKEILQVLYNIRFMVHSAAINFVKIYKKDFVEEIKKFLENEPMYEIILEMINGLPDEINCKNGNLIFKDNQNNFSLQLQQPVGFNINDNALNPLIKQGDKVTLEIRNKYNNSEIVAYKLKNNKEIKIRLLSIANDTYIFSALPPNNTSYKTEMYNRKDVIILGKVDNVIKKM